MSDSRPSASPLIGRARELNELRGGLSVRQSGRGCLLLVRGEAGIGKTRLAEEICAEARARGQSTHWGSCIELAGAPAFWPWVQVLRSMVAEPDSLAAASAGERASLGRMLAEPGGGTGARPDGAGETEPPALTPFQGEVERFQLFDGIASFLRRAGAGRPFGIVLDDLHAADPPTLLLLEFVARQLSTLPFWVIVTYRDVEARAEPQRAGLVATLERLGRPLTLSGMSEPEVAGLIASAVGEAPPEPMVHRIHDLTEGNPFFVGEIARLLWPGGTAAAERDAGRVPIPSGVREVVRQRLGRLDADCVRMLEAAAVIGRESSFVLLREAAGTQSAPLLDLLEQAVAVRVLVPQPGRRYAFGHALIREVLYDDLAASARVDLHRRVGEAIERLHPSSCDEHLAELAFHFARVAPVAEAAKALDYAERAARRAAASLAYEDAARCYELALETLPLLPDGEADRRRVDLLLALGEAHIRAGDMPRARAVFERAAEAARSRGDAHALARAALGCGGLGLGVPAGSVDGALVGLLEEALARDAAAYPRSVRARLLARLALELYFSDAAPRRRTLMNEACSLAGESDAPTRAYVGHARLVGLWDITPPEERMRWSTDLMDLAGGLGDDDLALRGHGYRLLEIIDTGIAEGWEPELDAQARLVERLREPRFRSLFTGSRAMRSVWLGAFAEAEALGRQALAEAPDDLQAAISVAVQTFFMRRLAGPSEEAEALARASAAGAPTIPGTRCMVVLALCDRGRFDEARAEMERLGDTDFDVLRRANRIASLVPWLAEASFLLGDRARMQSLYRDLLPLLERNISLQARVCFGPAAFYLGMIAAGLGRHDEAIGHFESAHALATRMRGRPLVALIELEHARALAATGAASEARALLDAARDTAVALGLHGLLARIENLQAECAEHERSARDDAWVEEAEDVSRAAGERGRVVAFPRRYVHRVAGTAKEPPPDAPRAQRDPTAVLRRDGRLWTIASGGVVFRCKSSKGLVYLAELLRHPGKSFHVLELVALDAPADAGGARPGAADLEHAGMRVGSPQFGEPIADAKAITAYRKRLADLSEELAEAERFNDLARSERLQEEVDVLTQALASAVGLGGRARAAGSFIERARLNVTRAIRSAIERVGEGHADLGQHLSATVRTGTLCSYVPGSGDAPRWEL